MLFIRSLGWVDTWPLSVSLYQRSRNGGAQQSEDGLRVLKVRDGRWQHPDLAKWTTLRKAITQANKLIAQQAPNMEIARADLETLEPSSVIPWQKTEEPSCAIILAIVTNPGSLLFVGNEAMHLATGQIAYQETGIWHSAINAGSSPRTHLVLRLRKRDVEEETA